jgi:mono/diheme cytochrome c family protein
MNIRRVAASLLGLSLALTGLAGAHEVAASRYNYHDDVRPLFVEHCGGCHHQGGSAPMSLLEYQEAVPWANAIKLQVLEGRMPPFLPDDESGPFLHRRGLTAEEIDIIVDWTVGATPEGDPLPPSDDLPSSVSRWSGGKPDLVLQQDEPVVLGEDESQTTACVVLKTSLAEPRKLSRFEVAPGTASILRRATLFLGDSCSQGEPILSWLPDRKTVSFPQGLGRELPASTNVAVELRYKKGWGQEGKRIADRSAVGLWFSSAAAPVTSMRIEREKTLGRASKLIGLYPDVSSQPDGAADPEPLRVEAVLPGGKTRVLLSVPSPDPAWVEAYFFRNPLLLPQGTELRISRPAVWADFVPLASPAGNDEEKEN